MRVVAISLWHAMAVATSIEDGYIVHAAADTGSEVLIWRPSVVTPYEPTFEERLALGRKQ